MNDIICDVIHEVKTTTALTVFRLTFTRQILSGKCGSCEGHHDAIFAVQEHVTVQTCICLALRSFVPLNT